MRKILPFATILFVSFVLSSCAGLQSESAYIQSYDFSKLKVYTIYPSTALKERAPVLASTISGIIDSILPTKGFIRGNEIHDFVVTFYTETEIETAYGSVNFERWRGFWSNKEEPLFTVKGLIVIDLIDANTGQVIWRGWETRLAGREDDPKTVIRSVISDIFAQFPPK